MTIVTKLPTVALITMLLWVSPASAGAGDVPTCCSCQDCPAGVSACTELPSGTADTTTFIAEVCVPLGCTGGAGCLDADCDDFGLCTEEDQCTDGIDNDADGLTDCADSVCSGETVCGAGVPALSWVGLGALLTALAGLGLARLRKA